MKPNRMKIICTFRLLIISAVFLGGLWAGPDLQAKELVKNTAFKGSLSPWKIWWNDGKVKDLDMTAGDGEIRIRVTMPSNPPYLQIHQEVRVKEGKKYTLKFESKTDAVNPKATPLRVVIGQKDSPWDYYGLKKLAVLEDNWTPFSYTFTATKIDSKNKPTLRFSFGDIPGNVYIRNVSLTETRP